MQQVPVTGCDHVLFQRVPRLQGGARQGKRGGWAGGCGTEGCTTTPPKCLLPQQARGRLQQRALPCGDLQARHIKRSAGLLVPAG